MCRIPIKSYADVTLALIVYSSVIVFNVSRDTTEAVFGNVARLVCEVWRVDV